MYFCYFCGVMDYLSTILKPIEGEMEEFKRRYSLIFTSADAQIDALLKFLLARRGKFMRPILVLLVAKSFGCVNDSVYHLASSVELLHQGSLIHDDVVDESDLRRGKPSVNSAFDNKMAVLLGDFIVSQALQQVASSHIECVKEISRLIGTLSEGEIIQIDALDSPLLSEDVYFDIISRKTAYLFSISARLSALLSGASKAEIDAFEQFAYKAGLCFQIMDDILDYHSQSETGKASGNDLKEGKFTLPSIYALNHSDRDWSAEIKSIRSLTASAEVISKVTDYSISNGGIEYATAKMRSLKEEAFAALPCNMPEQFRAAFKSFLDLITDRIC